MCSDQPPNFSRQTSSGAGAVDFSLSQGTLEQILAETGDIVDHVNSSSLTGAPVAYSADLNDSEAESTHTVPHSFTINTESVQLIPGVSGGSFSQQISLNTPQGSMVQLGNSASSLMRDLAPYLQPLQSVGTQQEFQTPAELKPGETTLLVNNIRRLPSIYDNQPRVGVAMTSQAEGNDVGQAGTSAQQNGEVQNVNGGVPSVSPVVPVSAMTDFPSNTSYPGPFGFEVFFSKAQEAESKKTISYIYSVEEHKLYVRMKVHCPVHFKTARKPPQGSRVRAMAIYSRPQDVGDVVKRCMNHTMEDKDQMDHPDHLVRCHNRGALYEEVGSSRRHSVSVPLDDPPPGSDSVQGIYEFMCFSSCSGTINRRPTQLIFTLEHNGDVIGRQVVELRICACPGRDIVLSEGTLPACALKRKNKQTDRLEKVTQFTTLEPLAKRPVDNEIFTVQVRGRDLYKIVMTIIRNYEVSRQYEELVSLIRQEQARTVVPDIQSTHRTDMPSVSSTSAIGGHMLPEQLQPDTTIVDYGIPQLRRSRSMFGFGSEPNVSMNDDDLGEREDRERLYGSFIQWRSIFQHRALSSLSTMTGSEQGSQGGTVSNGSGVPAGYRIAKTTVRATYKLPKKRAGFGAARLLGKKELND